jgi:ferrous iron transport protein B
MSAPPPVDYGPEIEAVLETTRTWLAALPPPKALPTPELGPGPPDPEPTVAGTAARWTAIRVLEGDSQVCEMVAASPGGESILAARDQLDRHLQQERGPDLSLVLAERRFERAHHIADRVVASAGSSRRQISDRMDRIVTHRILGPLVLLAVMWGVFQLVTDVAGPFVD